MPLKWKLRLSLATEKKIIKWVLVLARGLTLAMKKRQRWLFNR